jgi:hypothetical protein
MARAGQYDSGQLAPINRLNLGDAGWRPAAGLEQARPVVLAVPAMISRSYYAAAIHWW